MRKMEKESKVISRKSKKEGDKEPRKVSSGRCFTKPREGDNRTGMVLLPN